MAIATFPTESVNAHVERLTDWIMSTDEALRFLARNRGIAHILILSDHGRSLVCVDHIEGWTYERAERLARQKGYDTFGWVNTDGRYNAYQLRGTDRYEQVSRRILSQVA